jgi:hypothetical protein
MNGAIPTCFNGVDKVNFTFYFLLARLRRLKLSEVSRRHLNCCFVMLGN